VLPLFLRALNGAASLEIGVSEPAGLTPELFASPSVAYADARGLEEPPGGVGFDDDVEGVPVVVDGLGADVDG